MTHFLFTALCALLLNAGAPADTLNHYVIDNQPVANFDGSQLLGDKIELATDTAVLIELMPHLLHVAL